MLDVLGPDGWYVNYSVVHAGGVSYKAGGEADAISARSPDGSCVIVASERDHHSIATYALDGHEVWRISGTLGCADSVTGTVLGWSASGRLMGWSITDGSVIWESGITSSETDALDGKCASGVVAFATDGGGPAFTVDARTGSRSRTAQLPGGDLDGFGSDFPVALSSDVPYLAGLSSGESPIAWERNDIRTGSRIVVVDGTFKLAAAVVGADEDHSYLVLIDAATGREEWVFDLDSDEEYGCGTCFSDIDQSGPTTLIVRGEFGIDLRTGQQLFRNENDSCGNSSIGWPQCNQDGITTYLDPTTGGVVWS
ncbi:MAG TPA: PQQ-binding-like beta-propeller repeat protein, partial [Ilumatobacteraceae bacterium]|nr:PQQ-binding-like beta-propeller repeat protein [Ilumatobacteraceae bacterium]